MTRAERFDQSRGASPAGARRERWPLSHDAAARSRARYGRRPRGVPAPCAWRDRRRRRRCDQRAGRRSGRPPARQHAAFRARAARGGGRRAGSGGGQRCLRTCCESWSSRARKKFSCGAAVSASCSRIARHLRGCCGGGLPAACCARAVGVGGGTWASGPDMKVSRCPKTLMVNTSPSSFSARRASASGSERNWNAAPATGKYSPFLYTGGSFLPRCSHANATLEYTY